MFRQLWFQTHWFIGITAGLVLAVMGLTGALYSFQPEIIRLANPRAAEYARFDAAPLPIDELVRRLQAHGEGRRMELLQLRHRQAGLVLWDTPPGEARMLRRFDPGTGVLLAQDEIHGRAFFDFVIRLHRYLTAGDTGKAVTGASTLALLVSCLTGLYLRWPRKPLQWRAWLTLDWMRKGRSFQWDLHAVAGTWCLLLYLLFALTGLWWSYDWYRNGLRRMMGETPVPAAVVADAQAVADSPPAVDYVRVWRGVQSASGMNPELVSLRWPRKQGDPVTGSYRLQGGSDRTSSIELDPLTGELLKHDRYADRSVGRKLLSNMYPLHSGEFFGLPGRIVMMAASLLMPLFLVTGLWLYLDRRGKRRQARRQQRALAGVSGGGADAGEGWLIGFASQSGTAEQLAWRTAGQLQAAGHPVTVQPLGRLQESELAQARQALFIVSTFGEGEPPDSARGFERRRSAWRPDLSALRYAVLALGDRQYAQFCGFARQVDVWLAERGAQALFAPVEVDNGDAQALVDWQQRLGRLTGIEPAPEPASVPFASWCLLERRHLNPDSEGAPVYQVSLAAESLQAWQAGDVLEVQVPAGAERAGSVTRDYSIASLPSDGRLDLIVRQAVREDGSLGAGSGWLTAQVPVGGWVQARVRSNRGFHAPEDGRPVILVGNGTGMAGLRSLLKARIAAGHRRNWLLFGERKVRCDFFCGDEIEAWHAQGGLARVDLAFSRDQGRKVYVQDRLRAAATELRAWVSEGASIYVCGSLEGMAGGVDAVLKEVLGEDAVLALVDEGRYRRDVY